jgi:hypothetical protein
MSVHSWDEPQQHIRKIYDKEAGFRLLTPKIGEIVFLKDTFLEAIKYMP